MPTFSETSPRIIIEIGHNANITCRMNLKMFDGENSSSLYFTSDEPEQEVVHTNIRVNKTKFCMQRICNLFTNFIRHRSLTQQRLFTCCATRASSLRLTRVKVVNMQFQARTSLWVS